ncbi:hypothetical protein [Halobaculum sp. D14]|uniref:hypothetical protein n=1 Tax=Halobaculum sp. D14 TaxID=3421642 RepID=UPI003EB6C1D2
MSTNTLPTQERTDDEPTWRGPFPEYDRFGEPTGCRFVECRGCGCEVIAGHEQDATHRDGCPL